MADDFLGLRLPKAIGRERGIALLALLALLALGGALALLAMANPVPRELKREEVTSNALAKAKSALIAYATTYGDAHPGQVPGYLPCPDLGISGIGGEGSAEASCGTANTTIIGRLPWKTLGIEPPRDGYGECLWYAVSGTFKNNPKTEVLNWDTVGQIRVYAPDGTLLAGSQPENLAAAVIFAPGAALGQDRQDDNPATAQRPVCSEDYLPARFLESVGGRNNAVANSTPGGVSEFVAGEKGDAFNDRLLFVTPKEIFAPIEKRPDFRLKLDGLAQSAAQCLTEYVKANSNYAGKDRRFPWTAPAGLTGYTADSYYDDTNNSLSGRYPYRVDTTQTVVANSTTSAQMIERAACPFHDNPPIFPIGPDQYWWTNWKDHLFYALSPEFKPSPSTNPSPASCGTGCLQVNGVPGQVAVVMFAGRGLPGQTRSSDLAKGSIGNYLEGRNPTNDPNDPLRINYEARAGSADFNDVLYCVTLDVTGNPIATACPPPP
jgi:type II secretory pathway pseudopilin PulG